MVKWVESSYDSGELFGADVALGLPLPVRCADDMFGVAEAEAETRLGGGDFGADTGAIST